MYIIADKYIPYLQGLLEPIARVEYLDPEEMTAERLREADALLIRTRTRCNAALLEGSKVRFIATATIGYDHIDTAYCEQHGIFWTNAPGCNAQGVCDYVEAAIDHYLRQVANFQQPANYKLAYPVQPTIGIVGVGHVGRLVAQMAQRKGFRVLLNDPPRAAVEPLFEHTPITTIARESDIVTFHTPFIRQGRETTYHLCDRMFMQLCKSDALIINAARGGILDEQAALLPENEGKTFIIDTWEGEPKIDNRMLQRAAIATYHIAGYTVQGKQNATRMCVEALLRWAEIEPTQTISNHLKQLQTIPTPTAQGDWLLPIDKQLRENPQRFEQLRESYPLR